MGLKLAQVALSYGADDLHRTIIEEHDLPAIADGNGDGESHSRNSAHASATKYLLRTDQSWDAAPTATEAEPPANKSKVLEDNLATA